MSQPSATSDGEADVLVDDPAPHVRRLTLNRPQALNARSMHVLTLIGEHLGTATDEDRSGIPTSYALHGNYPNPFNPTTTIQIDLPETAIVTLAVYDVLGQEVLRLESGTVSAGRHRYTVDASRLPSGVYLYRLETPAFTQSRRMMLLK